MYAGAAVGFGFGALGTLAVSGLLLGALGMGVGVGAGAGVGADMGTGAGVGGGAIVGAGVGAGAWTCSRDCCIMGEEATAARSSGAIAGIGTDSVVPSVLERGLDPCVMTGMGMTGGWMALLAMYAGVGIGSKTELGTLIAISSAVDNRNLSLGRIDSPGG